MAMAVFSSPRARLYSPSPMRRLGKLEWPVQRGRIRPASPATAIDFLLQRLDGERLLDVGVQRSVSAGLRHDLFPPALPSPMIERQASETVRLSGRAGGGLIPLSPGMNRSTIATSTDRNWRRCHASTPSLPSSTRWWPREKKHLRMLFRAHTGSSTTRKVRPRSGTSVVAVSLRTHVSAPPQQVPAAGAPPGYGSADPRLRQIQGPVRSP